MANRMFKIITIVGISVISGFTALNANALDAKIFTIGPQLGEVTSISSEGNLHKASGYHWVRPYFRRDGTFVQGHMRGNPDGFCWNNLSGC